MVPSGSISLLGLADGPQFLFAGAPGRVGVPVPLGLAPPAFLRLAQHQIDHHRRQGDKTQIFASLKPGDGLRIGEQRAREPVRTRDPRERNEAVTHRKPQGKLAPFG
jgi:hypothetical protein